MNDHTIHVLLVEGDRAYVEYIKDLITEVIREIKILVDHAPSLAEAIDLLDKKDFDVVLMDLTLPDSMGLETFQQFNQRAPNMPVVLLSSLDDSQVATQAVSEGAQDYLPKRGLSSRLLLRSIRYAIERHKLVLNLQQALNEVRTLRGFLPICSNCKKIRNDKGYWQAVEVYVQEHSDAQFSHGICPECLKKLYPEFATEIV
ncbi:MAG: response regulator [Desulfomonilaceae bacterium]|jgi:DNA-binding response OmpR family regulator